MKPSYLNLCAEFYDLTKPEAGLREVAFYEALVHASKGPVLEAMCGSGRLLIPLLKRGLVVDGVDNSSHMLKSCQKRCEEQNLHVQLYNQSLQTLSLPQKYDLIFIAIGSFQLIHEQTEALKILETLRMALLPRGRLVLETFIPWDAIKENVNGSIRSDQSRGITVERTASSPDGFEIINQSKVTVNFKEQLEISQTRYEKWADGKLIYAEEEEYIVRWYHRYEMELFLEKAGFSSVKIIDASFEQNEQAVVYVAHKPERE
jgi:SAM-dependent methyltransferase